MAVDTKQYLETLAQTAGLDAETKSALLKAVENEKFATELAASMTRQEDYSRNMDALRKDRTTFETERTSWKDWYTQATAREAEINAELEDLRKRANAGGAGGGNGGGNGGAGGMTRKELEDMLAGERGRLIAVTKDMGVIAARHAVEFPKVPFDVNAIEKIALDKKLTVVQAYEEYVRPQVEERTRTERAAELAAARAEGVKEGLSKHGLPDDSAAPRGHHVLFDRPRPTNGQPAPAIGDRQRAANFAEAWNTQAATPANK